MPKFKVLVDFTNAELEHKAGDEVELTQEVADPLVAEGKLEIVAE